MSSSQRIPVGTRSVLYCLLLLPMLLPFWSCQTTSTTDHPGLVTNKVVLDSILNSYVEGGFYPFIYARLEDIDGKVLYEHSVHNPSLISAEVDKDTWIRIWSMSKIVTISLALDLIEEGILQFDDPVTKYIPEFSDLQVAVSEKGEGLATVPWGEGDPYCPVKLVPNDSVMTVSHLINHQAGFYYATSGFACLDSLIAAQNLPSSKNAQEFIDRLAKLPLVQHPGTTHFYGINTTVLGLVAERATGKSLKQLVAEHITSPLQIEGLQYGLPTNTQLLPRVSGKDTLLREAHAGELDIFGPDVPDYDPGHELYLGGEGMLATADGYADFLRMLLKRGTLNKHRFLDKSTVEDIYAPHTQLDNPYGYNGYNLWISGDSMRINNYGEAGLWIGGGYESTHFWVDPRRNFVGIIMSQMSFTQAPGYYMNDKFRGALYEQIWAAEEQESKKVSEK